MEQQYPSPGPPPAYDELDENYSDVVRAMQNLEYQEAVRRYDNRGCAIGMSFKTRFQNSFLAACEILNTAKVNDPELQGVLARHSTLQIEDFDTMLFIAERLEYHARRLVS
jgi:hypothetical protein